MEGQNEPSTSANKEIDFLTKIGRNPIQFYPEGHPMNDIKQLEEDMFGHLKTDVISITKRRKMLRRLERRKERILNQNKELIPTVDTSIKPRKGSLWDVKELPQKTEQNQEKRQTMIGPKQQTMYTIKDSKIVRLEPVKSSENVQNEGDNIEQEYKSVDIIIHVNAAEKQLLEGTKMCVDDIRKIERFKDYQPGIPSKVLYIKNISPSVTQEQFSLLFNQFHLQNGRPVDIKLMSGRMRGQAFVSFQSEELAIQALEELNGTVLGGKPVIVQFGRNSNRIQDN